MVRTAPALTADHVRMLAETFSPPMKDQYEKTSEYSKRVEIARQKQTAEARDAAARLPPILKFTTRIEPTYNADKELVEESSFIGNRIKKIDGRVSKFFVLLTADGKESTTTIGLGAKRQSRSYFGVAYQTSLKSRALQGGALRVKLSPAAAQLADGHVGVAVAGPLMPPWKLSEYHEKNDLDTLTVSSSSDEMAIMKVVCAALVDMRSGRVIHQFD
jgi:hypothetical protein